jgi:hypothetical protein
MRIKEYVQKERMFGDKGKKNEKEETKKRCGDL